MSVPDSARVGHPPRRGLLQAAAVVAGAAGLAACEGGPLRTDADPAVGGPSAADPDEAILVAAARDEAGMLAMLQPLLATGPPALRRTVQVHRAHLALLDDAVPDGESAAPGGRLRLRGIAAAEEGLARRHAQAAVRASSGQFARLLAGMAAAAAQQAEVWRASGGDG